MDRHLRTKISGLLPSLTRRRKVKHSLFGPSFLDVLGTRSVRFRAPERWPSSVPVTAPSPAGPSTPQLRTETQVRLGQGQSEGSSCLFSPSNKDSSNRGAWLLLRRIGPQESERPATSCTNFRDTTGSRTVKRYEGRLDQVVTFAKGCFSLGCGLFDQK